MTSSDYAGRKTLECYDVNLMRESALKLTPGDFQDPHHLNCLARRSSRKAFCAALYALKDGSASGRSFLHPASDRWADRG
jgi:hypothetical protein